MSDTPEILNTTRYDGQDVWNCVQRMIPATEQISDVKIRYLMKPTKQSSRKLKGGTWALVNRPWQQVGGLGGPRRAQGSYLEIALLHPDRLDLPEMVVIARAASDEDALTHPRIVSDLIEEVANLFGKPSLGKVAQAANLKIKLCEKVDPAAKKMAAFRTFEENVESRRQTIQTRERSLVASVMSRNQAQQRINKLQKKIPELKAKQQALEEELKRRTAKMLAPDSRLND